MEEKSSYDHAKPAGRFLAIMTAAAQGDKAATEEILAFFRNDIEQLSKFMRMPREEAIQILTLELIELIRYRYGFLDRQQDCGFASCAEPGASYGERLTPQLQSG